MLSLRPTAGHQLTCVAVTRVSSHLVLRVQRHKYSVRVVGVMAGAVLAVA